VFSWRIPLRYDPGLRRRQMGTRTLSEYESMRLLAAHGVPVARERLVPDPEAVPAAAAALGFPVAVKLCGARLAHKSERALVRLDLRDGAGAVAAARELWARRAPEDGAAGILVAEMIRGRRELLAGVVRDPQFGPCVLLGVGGVLAEALSDVVMAVAPLTPEEGRRMVTGLRMRRLFTHPFRGEPPLDLDALAAVLVALGELALARPDVRSVDVNPLIVRDRSPVAADALVELDDGEVAARPGSGGRPLLSGAEALERLRPLFHPRGIIVAGVSAHPGKFGFVAFHNLLCCGYRGALFPVTRDGGEVLGRPTLRDVGEVPPGQADLAFVCTPVAANVDLLRASRRVGVRAAFVASGGYAESGAEGRELEIALARTADALDMALVGPNGQGVICTSASLCAQIVSPYPPAGRIGVVSQSGNIVSALLNYAVLTAVGVSKAVSCGNAAQTTLADFLSYFAADAETDTVVAYLEGIPDGPRFVEAVRLLTAVKPLVVLRGGVAAEGQRAASSHTGALATDDRVFAGLCRQLGVLRAPTVEHAFEWAATLTTQPLPRGRRTAILTSAGGWGVLAADACAAAGLALPSLPDDLRREIDALLPARWSRNNPIDLAGGETRDTIPALLERIAAHPAFDAVVYLGAGIQANQAHALRTGGFYPDFGIARIVEFHERQDRRYGEAAREVSLRNGKPVLVASELVYADRDYGNAAPLAVRAGGRICYPSAHRAVDALAALCDYAEYRGVAPIGSARSSRS
jgi:acetyltransferase